MNSLFGAGGGQNRTGLRRLRGAGQFPRIAKLRKGAEQTGNRPGRDLDHFRFVPEQSEDLLMKRFIDAYGQNPKQITVYMPHKNVEENFSAYMEEWTGSGELRRRCEGMGYDEFGDPDPGRILVEVQEGVRVRNPTNDEGAPKQCLLYTLGKCGCKEKGRLRVILPELGIMGYTQLETTSVIDDTNIYNTLSAMHELIGDLRGIPFLLNRYKAEVPYTDPKTGKKRKGTHWFVGLQVDPEYTMPQQIVAAFGRPDAAQEALRGLLPNPAGIDESHLLDGPQGGIYIDLNEEDAQFRVEEPEPAVDQEREQLLADVNQKGQKYFGNDWEVKRDEQAGKLRKGAKFADLTIPELEKMGGGIDKLQEKRDKEAVKTAPPAPSEEDEEAPF